MALDLLERIEYFARGMPDRIAHISEDRRLSYAELESRANCLASHLTQMLPADKSPVVVVGHKEPEMLIAFLGVVKSGHPYVPLDLSIPRQRVEHIVQASGSQLVLTAARVAELAATPKAVRTTQVAWNDPYYIIFTSGSTGEPKGVVITLECLCSFVEWMLKEQQFEDLGEVFLNQAPFSFDLSVMDLYLSLATGGTLYSITADQIANPKRMYEAFSTSGVTTWVSTPSFAEMSLAEKGFGERMLPRVKRFLFCGETLAPEVALQLLERFPRAKVWNTYGPTEATCATTSLCVDRSILQRYSPLPVGYPKTDASIFIFDAAGEGVGPGEEGEIVIAGPNVSIGYLGRPDLNQRVFFELGGRRAYRTGDLGRMRDGMLFFDGRKDTQVKLHGYRVELGDVESNLRALPGIRDAVVIPSMKHGRPDSLTAFIILSKKNPMPDFQATLELRSKLAERVPSYMIPRKFQLVEAFPLTANGKADRRKLAEQLQAAERHK
jgi:D-alanine--poly(phosphoribitol) ligase subunit 1